jgi:predicted ATPase
MTTQMLGAEPPATLLALLGDRAAGMPLAVEGLVDSLVQSGQLSRSHGRWVLDASEAPLPQSLRDLILDRLDRLDPAAREVADTVAVGADGLSHEILQAVVSVAGDELVAAIRTAAAVSATT